jgi:hypothetical protein
LVADTLSDKERLLLLLLNPKMKRGNTLGVGGLIARS